jgi:hypothetical protein
MSPSSATPLTRAPSQANPARRVAARGLVWDQRNKRRPGGPSLPSPLREALCLPTAAPIPDSTRCHSTRQHVLRVGQLCGHRLAAVEQPPPTPQQPAQSTHRAALSQWLLLPPVTRQGTRHTTPNLNTHPHLPPPPCEAAYIIMHPMGVRGGRGMVKRG